MVFVRVPMYVPNGHNELVNIDCSTSLHKNGILSLVWNSIHYVAMLQRSRLLGSASHDAQRMLTVCFPFSRLGARRVLDLAYISSFVYNGRGRE